MRAYLAHPHAEREYGKKIQKLLEDSGYLVCNPFDREDQERLSLIAASNRPFTDDECENLVEGDLSNLSVCDVVVAIFKGSVQMVGTCMEVFYASNNLMMPVFSLYLWQNYGNGVVHPWVNYLTTVVHTEEDLIKEMASFYG